jgi:cation transport ATPase
MLTRSDALRPMESARSVANFRKHLRPIIVGLPAIGLVVGLLAHFLGWSSWAGPIWASATIPVLIALVVEIIVSLRRGDVGLDIVAALSMFAALVFVEYLAAVVVALMYAGGQYLESFAERRASREMTALLARVRRSAMRYEHGRLEEVDLDAIEPGDRLVIRKGDVVSVDGTVIEGLAVLDQAALTGESMPVQKKLGDSIMSGSSNVGEPFHLLTTRRAAESTYAGIVRLVEAAQRSRAPMSRLADRYAMVFLAATIALAGASWIASADPIRAVAVLVVATPCPLILAVPVAMVSGLSAASLDQASKHIVAQTIVAAAEDKDLGLAIPHNIIETPGEGVEGWVDGRHVIVGGLRFVSGKLAETSLPQLRVQRPPGSVTVAVGVDGRLAGLLILADRLRAGTEALLRELKTLGLTRIVLATGDRRDVAQMVVRNLPIDAVRAELNPDQKTLVVLSERKNGPVMMIGDGVNDAPALAAADLGVAMGAKGAAASAEVADVVLLVDQLDRILPAIKIARRSRFIALESVYAGLGLSVAGMIAAALGLITPVQGAIFQEAIDIAVILNALRALHGPSV